MDKKRSFSYDTKKFILVLVHIVSIFTLLVGVSIVYSNENFHLGFTSLNQKNYENSPEFTKDLEKDIKYIFDYERYKYIFEVGEKFDKNLEMFTLDEGPDNEKTYTLREILDYAKSIGFYINEDYQVSRTYEKLEDMDTTKYLVTWKKYAPIEEIKEPGDAYKTLEDLSMEVLSRLAKYYEAYKNLKLNPRNIYYKLVYESYTVDNKSDLSLDSVKKYGKYLIINSDSMIADTNIKKLPNDIYKQATKGIYDPGSDSAGTIDENYNIYIAIDTTYPHKDIYYQNNLRYEKERQIYFRGVVLLILSGFVAIFSLIILILMSGKTSSKDKNIKLSFMDRYSIEIRALFSMATVIVFSFLSERIIYKFIHIILDDSLWKYGEKLVLYTIVYFVVLIFIFSFVRSFKSKDLWKNSFIKHIKEEGSLYRNNYTYLKRFTSNYILYYLMNFGGILLIMALLKTENTLAERLVVIILILVLICFNVLVFYDIYKRNIAIDKISEAIDKMSAGDAKISLDLDEFSGKEKTMAQRVNNIGSGFSTAINEQVKSERLKADLITNVSHDIRTPLTSIINYIDLIKRENIEDETIKSYVSILETKSLYLKNLTEDLLEASKAASGNVNVNLNEIDFVQIIKQTNGEFEEKYNTRGLSIVSKFSEDKIRINADGRHLWRVLENLYNNAYKYAIENSRVYINLGVEGKKAIFTMKNVSKNALNISPEELTMRFVRGDSSRSTEGSGLGLSIAKSLTTIQGGELEIEIDGDLFKISLIFEKLD